MSRSKPTRRASSNRRRTPNNLRVVDEWIDAADDVVLECRVGRHRFPGITDIKKMAAWKDHGTIVLNGACERGCGVECFLYLPSTGILEDGERKLVYPADGSYLRPKGAGRVTKVQMGKMRMALVERRADL